LSETEIKSIVIVGGGTAGWMTAAALAKVLGEAYSIRLVESEAIGTVGVGEGSVPHIRLFNSLLQVEEADFVRSTQGTFKLGVQFNDWLRIGSSYVHGFGNDLGHSLGHLPFHQCWIRAFHGGIADELGVYSLNSLAAPRGKFMVSATDVPRGSPLANVAYAYHFDTNLYAKYLRAYAEQRGVRRTEGVVARVDLHPETGFVEAIRMEGGEEIRGDLFVDCSGFRGLLIEEALETGFEDFTRWLPCDRAVVVGSGVTGPPTPYTRASARGAGWQWRIPLQHRVGNGYVYSSAHCGEDEAAATLLEHIDGPALGDPRVLRFRTGRRRRFWNRNVVAIGLSSGFMEPLESTGIHLIQSGIARLLNLFPRDGFGDVLAERYNAQAIFEFDRIRDFLVLHYHATERDDTAFWNECRTMQVPPELQATIDLFRHSGRFFRNGDEMFAEMSWVQIMVGQGIVPMSYSPLVDRVPMPELAEFMESVKGTIAACVDAMPMHQAFIDRHCKAGTVQ
jgi:tryptophan halogenase